MLANLRSLTAELCESPVASSLRNVLGFPAARGERVAIVDDEEAMTTVTSTLLKRLGYSTVAYNCASRFKDAFEAAPNRVDLVVADVVMPGMSGVQLVHSLRDSGHEIPILLMTGFTVQPRLPLGPGSGRISFVRKPFSTAHLAQAVRRLLSAG